MASTRCPVGDRPSPHGPVSDMRGRLRAAAGPAKIAAMSAAPSAAAVQAVRVWDLPTRLFHWLLAAAVLGSLVSANIGGNAMVWHFRFGYALLALLAFRLVWGLIGGRWSRFVGFVRGPGTLWRYLRGRSMPEERLEVGHTPLGALSVIALLALLSIQLATGLVADDEIASIGPLNRFVDLETGLAATAWHKGWGKTLILALVGLHLLAIAYHVGLRRRPLLRAMFNGDKPLPADTPPSRDGWPQRLLALAVAAAAVALAMWVASFGRLVF
jgi:cytochrome b